MPYKIKEDNFESLKATFATETGKKWDDNIDTYISYYHAKMIDTQAQLIGFIFRVMPSNT